VNLNEQKIRIEGLSKIFHSRRQTITALQDINIQIDGGDFVSIVGPSGCGKSTIIRIIDDIIKPSSGKIYIDGQLLNTEKRIPKDVIRKIGFIFQQPNMYPWLTVRENVALPVRTFGLKGQEWEDYIDELMAMARIDQYANAYPVEISGGMMQRAGVVRAMVHKPEILLMDEPFGALDEMTREQLNLELLEIWKKTNMTIIFITHNVEEAVLLSSKAYVMSTNPGKIIAEVMIDLPRPRTLDMITDTKFIAYRTKLTNLIGRVDLSKIK
jgi:ABC-type nitrate/sulfonate/bicarbonate transport system, ATPase component